MYKRQGYNNFLNNPFIIIVLVSSLWALWYHFCTGLRHLYWDMGYGYDLKSVTISGWVAVIFSFVLTFLTLLFFISWMSDGIKHWKYSRVSSILLIPLTIWFVAFFSKNFGMPFEQVASSLSTPLNFLLMLTFITATIFHLQQGLQVIIEDYVYRRLWINLNLVFCSLLFIVSIISLGKLVLVGVLWIHTKSQITFMT